MTQYERLLSKIEGSREEIILFLTNLIKINSKTGNELEAQEFLKDKFNEIGLKIKKDFPNYKKIEQSEYYKLRGKEQVLVKDKERYNLIGSTDKEANLLLFTHIDTHQNIWKNAFNPKKVNNKLISSFKNQR